MIDISPEHLQIALNILSRIVPECEVRAFGSRFKWTAKDYSDLDLALVGDGKLPLKKLSAIKIAFEESDLPYRVDVLDWHSISPEFQKVIGQGYEVIQKAKRTASANEWRSTTWGEIATLEYGKGLTGYEAFSGRIPVYGTNGRIGSHTEALFNQAGVIIGRKGAYRGIHYSKTPFYVIDTAFYLKPKVEIDLRWAYYQLLTQDINGMDSGSAIPSTSRPDFYSLPVTLPPLSEQRAIAGILGALDDKIEVNRRMNATLESMARAVFRQWFVENEEVKKWKIGSLRDIAYIVKGVSYRSVDLVEESDTALVTLKSMERGGGYREDGLKPYAGDYKPEQKLSPGEVVIAHTDLTQAADVIGRAARIETSEKHPNLVASLDMAIVRPKEKPYTNEYLYGVLSQVEFSDHAYGYTNGTTVLHLSTKALPEYQLRIPPKNKVEEFSKLVSPIFLQIDNNKKESRTLASLRDSLLPKLMRGEVRVSEL
jgi:type I restriction enzyme S subunit